LDNNAFDIIDARCNHEDAYSKFIRTSRRYAFNLNLTVAKFFVYFHPLRLKSVLSAPIRHETDAFHITGTMKKEASCHVLDPDTSSNNMNHPVDDIIYKKYS